MDATAMDHVNLRYPEGELERALEFYVEKLGFEAEKVGSDENGEPYVDHPSHFSVRLGADCLIHMTPTSDPDIRNRYADGDRTAFDHVGILLDESIEEIKRRLAEHGVEIHREFEPGGAAGVAPAVFVLDPFGYMLELKVDPDRYADRNDAIRERHRAGETVDDIVAAFDTTPDAVRRIVTHRRESGKSREEPAPTE